MPPVLIDGVQSERARLPRWFEAPETTFTLTNRLKLPNRVWARRIEKSRRISPAFPRIPLLMTPRLLLASALFWGALLGFCPPLLAAPLIPASVFTDHMVLQRGKPVSIWGKAGPGDEIQIRFADQSKQARADSAGIWRATLDPMPASVQGRDLQLEKKGGEAVTLHDVVVGEVWLASGQSNMGIGLAAALNSRNEIAAARDPRLRFFQVPIKGSLTPLTETGGAWKVIAPENASGVSAVAYFFARNLVQKLDVPVGVLVSAVGATDAESWTSPEAIARDPEWNSVLTQKRAETVQNARLEREFLENLQKWRESNHWEEPTRPQTEWAQPDLEPTGWVQAAGRFAPGATLKMPSGGIVWLRKEFEVAPATAGKAASLWVDSLDRQILTFYLNGKEVGTLGLKGPRFYQSGLFSVPVPPGMTRAGRNVLAVRCTTFEPSSFKGFAAPRMRLPAAEPEKVDDSWLLRAETVFPEASPEARAALPTFTFADEIHTPGGLFNAMISPLIPYTLQGAIWYQGESNVNRFPRYRDLMAALIGDWRARWGLGDFPFYFVQLANYHRVSETPASTATPNLDDNMGRLREAQLQVSQTVPETGMAVTIDLGDISIHPPNKQDVGDRLARMALARTYQVAQTAHQGPAFQSMSREKNSLRIHFTDCVEGLMAAEKKGLEPARETPHAPLRRFAIAGADKRFVWAEARIEGTSVVVSSPQVTEPVAVRYAWAENPEGCNLYGKNGLPASPFRTDDFPAPPRR